ncbi:dual specificity protein phosphatase family protein [Marinomonas posidonica]|uniref:Dual specificity protein phosphatase n=1 Tax=Marinomonas posidonica (strain CECT 7376 / NCIMB 14433 / IVIA-Po-181) TaxID=491952 RepID=F6CU94_MARPP|nr:dual specificity protein phosphatase [Marinomonas posidonica]AEF55213.1 Dual specificity protein phosphatase [Marinomonas posidonica IVIA-Po-181]
MTTSNTKKRYPRPAISLIATDIPKYGIDVFIGGSQGAADKAFHQQHNIKVIFNCAVNLDIDLATNTDPKHQSSLLNFGSGHVRYYKIGLIDGPGNPAAMLLAGYHLMRSSLLQTMPEKASYPVKEKGNILVHCRGGRSRSVALVALFLHLEFPEQFPSLDAAINLIREKRELHPDEWFETPKASLIEATRRAAEMEHCLRQAGFGSSS